MSQENSEPNFFWPVRVYIEDTDAGGIVYHTNYLKYMERGRTEFLRSLGFEQKLSMQSTLQFVLSSASIKFVKPARMDMTLLVSVKMLKLGKSYFKLEQAVYLKDELEDQLHAPIENKLLCKAEITVACVHKDSLKPTAMPKYVHTRLQNC